jgi:hypothetical protein
MTEVAAGEEEMREAKRDIFLPSSRERQLDYSTCERLRFDRQHLEDGSRKNPGKASFLLRTPSCIPQNIMKM